MRLTGCDEMGERSEAISSVLPFLGLPLRESHVRIRHLRSAAVYPQVDVLQPLVVVAVGEVGAELRATRLRALDRADHDALRVVEHEAQLDRSEQVLVENRALVVDR